MLVLKDTAQEYQFDGIVEHMQGCHATEPGKPGKPGKRVGNFLIKSGKTLKSQGKKLKKHGSQWYA